MKKKLKFIYDNKEIIIESSGKLKLTELIKRSLSRKGIDLNKFIESNNKNLEKCRICKTHYPPFIIDCHEDNNLIVIDGFTPIRDKIYCYGLNKECPGIKMNSNSVEFISKTLLLSKDDALKYIKQNNKSSFYKENWDNDDDYKKSQKRDSEYFKNKYNGNWEVKYNEYINKIRKSNSLERYINEYGYDEGNKIFKSICERKDSISFEYFLSKNNDDYEKAKIEYNERLKSISVNLEGFINRYGEIEGSKKYNDNIERIKERIKNYFSNLTPEQRKEKYSITPEKIGQKKYNEWIVKTMVPFTRASKESEILFRDVISKLEHNDNDIYIGIDDKKEYFIRDGKKIFFYDFVIKSEKIIIEYNGVAWHPKLENIEHFKPIGTKLSAIELYNNQQYKISLAKSKGFKVLEIWSDDNNNLEKCLRFIKNNKNNE
jgi:hypothetical protein